MAIINTFPLDSTLNDKDAWAGADFASKLTKQYTAKSVADYLNTKGKVSIAGQMNYKFVIAPYLEEGVFAFPGGGGNGTEWSSITSIVISVLDLSGQDITSLLTYLIDEQVLFQDVSGKGSFGHYIVRGLQPSDSLGYRILTLEYLGGSGTVRMNEYYSLANFYMEIGATGVTSVDASDTTFVSMTPTTPSVGNVELTSSLSATGTPGIGTFLRGDNTWAADNNTIYYMSSTQESATEVDLRLTSSAAVVDTVKLVAGENIEIVDNGSNQVTFNASKLDSSFKEFTYTAGTLGIIKKYEDATKTTELVTQTFTYTNGLLTQLVTLYIATNVTSTKAFAYDANNKLISITETIS